VLPDWVSSAGVGALPPAGRPNGRGQPCRSRGEHHLDADRKEFAFVSRWLDAEQVVERIVGEGRHAASWIWITDASGTQPGLCFFELGDDGRIARITDFWPDPYELPAGRTHLVERY
jgi:hypothetical protein